MIAILKIRTCNRSKNYDTETLLYSDIYCGISEHLASYVTPYRYASSSRKTAILRLYSTFAWSDGIVAISPVFTV
jgi:hypothetical protein